MASPFLYYPVKNLINQNNLFGANPAAYAPLGQKGHPGNDFESITGTKVYAPCDGQAFYTTDSLGGCGLWIRTTQEGLNYNVILWHMPSVALTSVPTVSSATQYPYQIPTNDFTMTPVKLGQFLGYTDNSGYHPTGLSESTGQHLHLAIMPADQTWGAQNAGNGFLGCTDPTPFYTGIAAENLPAIESVVASAATLTQNIANTPDVTPAQKVTWMQEIITAVQQLL